MKLKHIVYSQDAEKTDWSKDPIQVESPDGRVVDDANTTQTSSQDDASKTDAQTPEVEYDKNTSANSNSSQYWYSSTSQNNSEATQNVNPNTGYTGDSNVNDHDGQNAEMAGTGAGADDSTSGPNGDGSAGASSSGDASQAGGTSGSGSDNSGANGSNTNGSDSGANSGQGGSGSGSGSGDGSGNGSGSGDSGSGDGSGNGSGSGDSGSGDQSVDPDKVGPVQMYDTWGEQVDPPEVSTIAACGELAVIVQMLSGQSGSTAGSNDAGTTTGTSPTDSTSTGTTHLVATDASLLTGKFSTVFADEGAGSIAKGWAQDGSSSSMVQIDALIAAKPETVLVTNSAYFTDDQKSKLSANNISITIVPTLESDTKITRAVEIVGEMLDKATNGVSTQRAEAYKTLKDSIVTKAKNGNAGQGSNFGVHEARLQMSGKGAYDANSAGTPGMYASSLYTLVVDNWDYGVKYSGQGETAGTVTTDGSGLGFFTVGYQHSPVSHYLSAAGVVNNAASIGYAYSDLRYTPLWQFSYTTYGDLSLVNWTSSLIRASGESKNISINDNRTGFVNSPFVMDGTIKTDSDSERAQKAFGSVAYPYVIVANQHMKTAMITNAKNSKGVYHVYDSGRNAGGYFSIIAPGTDLNQSVLVNPHGLFCNWITGSVESCLESAWVGSYYSNTTYADDVAVREEIKKFYEQMYRYSLTDAELSEILQGATS